uniref:CULLIN_2 domain-containing protein n=1 Tax=Ganoderma boninense TaxID=34458 RepID=A0A5K1JS34_9APHY|nr:CULLIN_2 domain-containing protein [Ganoderma boninense]
MEHSLPERHQRLPCIADKASDSLSIAVVLAGSPEPHAPDHWEIAVVTDESSRQCRVFRASDAATNWPTNGVPVPKWTSFAEDKMLDRSSYYQGGVRIGQIQRDDLKRLEEAICSDKLPPPKSITWVSEDWIMTVIRHLEAQGFPLVTAGLDDNHLHLRLTTDGWRARRRTAESHNRPPVFMPLSVDAIHSFFSDWF